MPRTAETSWAVRVSSRFGFHPVFLCVLAALWPAIRIGRTETLRLLQAGLAMV